MRNPACALYGFPPELDGDFMREQSARSVPIVRIAACLALSIILAFVVRTFFIPANSSRAIMIYFGVQLPGLLLWIAATFLPGVERYLHRVTFAVVVAIFGIPTVLFLAYLPGTSLLHQPVAAALVTMLFYAAVRLPFFWATAAGWLFFAIFMTAAAQLHSFQPSGFAVAAMYLVSTNVVGMYVAYAFEGSLRRDFLNRREIAAEREKSDRLLLNVLPAAVAERLKAGEKSIADDFKEVSILFGDIVGYTVLSGRMSASELVGLLNAVFSRFDALMERYGAEKIKTIGDAYMAVCGLSANPTGHAEAAVQLALQMFSELEEVNREHGVSLRLRIGINTGPVVAGVIGSRKFSYDLWGDAVNVASRMESHGIPGRVHVSETTAALLPAGRRVEKRAPMEIKGKGEMTTYLIAPAD